MTAHAVQAPMAGGEAVDLSRTLWRKQILKKGAISYKGRRIEFDDAYLADLASSFRAGAYDQVPFQLATPENQHNEDPERTRGEVKALIPTSDGLDALVELSEDGAKVLRDNPRLGVSARIVEALEHADGRRYPRAVRHVLGTLDPRVTGMSPWQAVELSVADQMPVLDLSQSTYEREATVPDQFSEEELVKLRALLAAPPAAAPPAAPAPPVGVTPPAADPNEGLDPELEAILAELAQPEPLEATATGASTPANPIDRVPAGAGAELSAETRQALDFAQAAEEQRVIELAQIRSELDATRWKGESEAYLAAGVPPKVLDLARPVLEGSGHTFDLANGSSVDAGTVMRAVLDELKGTVDLSGDLGGRLVAPGAPDPQAQARDMVALFQKQYGNHPGGAR